MPLDSRCTNEIPSAAGGSRRWRAVLAAAFLVAELSAVGLIGCGGGGGGDSGATGPFQAWPRLRRNDSNTGLALDAVGDNEGKVRSLYDFDRIAPLTPSGYPPILGPDRSIYLALDEGLLPLDASNDDQPAVGLPLIDTCVLADGEIPLRPVSSLTIGPNGLDFVVGSAGGNIFRLRAPAVGDPPTECRFAFSVGSRAAPLIDVDGFDLELLSFVVGTTAGRLTSISLNGQRRWSFPESQPFAGDVSSSPALLVGIGPVFASPDGRLHSVNQSGQVRWSATMGGAYPDGAIIPSPAAFEQIFTVNGDGDVVAYSPGGTRLWTFSADDGARFVGSVNVSTLTTDGGAFIGENVVFAVDENGILYGIGTNTGELVNFCTSDQRACLPSTCPDDPATGFPVDCQEVRRCSENRRVACPNGDECGPDDGSCQDQFFCSDDPVNEPELYNTSCAQDLCRLDNEDELDDTDGRCRREAKLPLNLAGVELTNSSIVSPDSFIVAATSDARVCARRLDGSVPRGRCQVVGGEPTNTTCSPDTCGDDGPCCDGDDDNTVCRRGYCTLDPSRACSMDTCDEGQVCGGVWVTGDGCRDLGATTTLSQPVVDDAGNIIVITDQGLAIVE